MNIVNTNIIMMNYKCEFFKDIWIFFFTEKNLNLFAESEVESSVLKFEKKYVQIISFLKVYRKNNTNLRGRLQKGVNFCFISSKVWNKKSLSVF